MHEVLMMLGVSVGTFFYHLIIGRTVKEEVSSAADHAASADAQSASANRKLVRIEDRLIAKGVLTPDPSAPDFPRPLGREPLTGQVVIEGVLPPPPRRGPHNK